MEDNVTKEIKIEWNNQINYIYLCIELYLRNKLIKVTNDIQILTHINVIVLDEIF